MARRMFSANIVESDAFLDMPLSTQGLYFHLNMQADDYGFVQPKRVMRMIGANDDDLKVLIAKRFILTFDSGVVVIKHWHVNNTIRDERSRMTTYKQEYDSLIFNEFKAYSEIEKVTEIVAELSEPTKINNTTPLSYKSTTSPPVKNAKSLNDNQIPAQNRIEENSNNTNVLLAKARTPKKDIDELLKFWEEQLGYAITGNIKKNRYACSNLLKRHGVNNLKRAVMGVVLASGDQYAPRISDFCGLQSRWNDLMFWGKKQQSKKTMEVI